MLNGQYECLNNQLFDSTPNLSINPAAY